MGINYYIVEKKEFQKKAKLDDCLSLEKANIEKLEMDFKDIFQRVTSSLDIEKTPSLNVSKIIEELINSCEIEKKHIGKNSYGWRFSFSAGNFIGLQNLIDSYNTEEHVILDEYDQIKTLDEFLAVVKKSLSAEKRSSQVINDEGYVLVSGDFS